ncbi:hypothetical protein H4S02_001757, partial [Coemansia sp. RSA 2611]
RRGQRVPAAVRVPGAARRAEEVPGRAAVRLEHLAVPVPQLWAGRGQGAGGRAGGGGAGKRGRNPGVAAALPRRPGLPLRQRDKQPGVPAVHALL